MRKREGRQSTRKVRLIRAHDLDVTATIFANFLAAWDRCASSLESSLNGAVRLLNLAIAGVFGPPASELPHGAVRICDGNLEQRKLLSKVQRACTRAVPKMMNRKLTGGGSKPKRITRPFCSSLEKEQQE